MRKYTPTQETHPQPTAQETKADQYLSVLIVWNYPLIDTSRIFGMSAKSLVKNHPQPFRSHTQNVKTIGQLLNPPPLCPAK